MVAAYEFKERCNVLVQCIPIMKLNEVKATSKPVSEYHKEKIFNYKREKLDKPYPNSNKAENPIGSELLRFVDYVANRGIKCTK